MAGQFQPRAFFRHASNSLLAGYFKTHAIDLGVDPAALEEHDIEHIWEAWLTLDDEPRKVAEADFCDIVELGDEGGTQVIVAQAPHDGLDIGDQIASLEDPLDRAFWVFLNHPELFEVAFRIRVAALHPARQWRKRKNLPRHPAECDENATRRLETALSNYFRTKQARGHTFKSEVLARGDQQYFFAYGEDHARAEQDFENGQLRRRSHRPAFEVVFVFNPKAGTLDTFALGGSVIAGELQEIFGREMLRTEIGKNEQDSRVYELEPFANRHVQLVYDPSWGIANISVVGLRVSLLAVRGTKVVLEAATQSDLYDRYERIVGPWSNGGKCAITQATLSVTYEPGPRAPKRKTFTVTFPNGCSLKQEERDLHLRQMLMRSGIDPTGIGLDAHRR